MIRIETKKDYQNYVDKVTPNSKTAFNVFKAFFVGGLICIGGQMILDFWTNQGLSKDDASSATSISLIFIGILLTALNSYNKIGKFAGAGSLIPITGFANSIVSPAMEYKSEGYVMGVGGKMFTVAGPVLVYGISSSIVVGILYFISLIHVTVILCNFVFGNFSIHL